MEVGSLAKKGLAVLLGMAVFLTAVTACDAESFFGLRPIVDESDPSVALMRQPGFYAIRGIRKFINSFASYQFPNESGSVDPLSRLESPIDQWFFGFQYRAIFSAVTLNAEVWFRLNEESGLTFQDTDWGERGFPADQVTTFSQSNSLMEDGYYFDLNGDWQTLSYGRATLGPVGGYRMQCFRFMAYDGTQFSLGSAVATPLAGDTIRNEYRFKDFYLGARSYMSLGRLGLVFQADYGWLTAYNFDHHLLRGELGGPLRGTGYSWHLCANVGAAVCQYVNLKLEYDFKRLVAQLCVLENHDEAGNITGVWDGAKIWSDQQSIAVCAEMRF